jgi:type IV secretory pathway component VirB8
MLRSYFKRIFNVIKAGDAREESYYSSLEELFKEQFKKYRETFSDVEMHTNLRFVARKISDFVAL